MVDDWPVVGSETTYENLHFSVKRDRVEVPDGETTDYYRIDFGQGGVIALGVDDGDVIFVDLYRPRLGTRMLELPGGGIDPGESPEAAAKREFAEETGLVPESARCLGSFHFSAWTRTTREIVWVDDFEPAPDIDPESEVLGVQRVPVDRALDAAREPPAGEWNVTALCLAQRDGLIEGL